MKVLRWLDNYIELVILAVLFSLMVIVTFLQVIMRYFMGTSLSGAEEIARYSFIWLVYIGTSYALKYRGHIRVEAITLLFKRKGKFFFDIIANVFFIVFALYVVYVGTDLAAALLSGGQTSASLHIPMGFIYMAAPVGMGLSIIRIIQNMIKDFKNFKNEEVY